MQTQEIADRLVDLCRQGQFEQAQRELYSDDVVSLEPEGTPYGTANGLEAVFEKGRKWAEMTEEVHSLTVSDPMVADRFIAVKMTIDSTTKGMGRSQSDEICLYEVKDGKIIKEKFLYTPPPMPG